MKNSLQKQNGKIVELELLKLLVGFGDRDELILIDSSGIKHQDVISSLQHEDGSGHSWNVTTVGGQKFHIRTVD